MTLSVASRRMLLIAVVSLCSAQILDSLLWNYSYYLWSVVHWRENTTVSGSHRHTAEMHCEIVRLLCHMSVIECSGCLNLSLLVGSTHCFSVCFHSR